MFLCSVFTSTVNVVFNGSAPIYNGDESSLPYVPLDGFADHYSRTKMLAEELVLATSGREGRFHACALRLNGLYGPHEQRHAVRIMEAVRTGLAPPVATFGRHTRQDFNHRDNAVQAHIKVNIGRLE